MGKPNDKKNNLAKLCKGHGRIIWDYDIKKLDFKNPKVMVWYLSRKINFGDFSGIKLADLKKYLFKLNINPPMKKLIRNFIKSTK